MVGFHNLGGTDIAPVSKKLLLKGPPGRFYRAFCTAFCNGLEGGMLVIKVHYRVIGRFLYRFCMIIGTR